jgi:hypothetical protein
MIFTGAFLWAAMPVPRCTFHGHGGIFKGAMSFLPVAQTTQKLQRHSRASVPLIPGLQII